MGTYEVFEGNMERLTKKLHTIQNKCKKYGSSFKFEEVGETFRTYTISEGNTVTVRYVVVEASGSVIHEDWEFIAVIDHAKSGNIIRQFKTDVEVPTKYYTTAPICEHCNTTRRRKDTYLIHNTSTGEWKQVGRTCLCEFTHGMDAEEVTRYISLFDEIIKGEAIGSGCSHEPYFPVLDVLKFAFETVKHFGYQRSTDWENYPTRIRCMDYYRVYSGTTSYIGTKAISKIKEEMDLVSFDPEEFVDIAHEAVSWVLEQEDNNSYLHNLRVICNSEYCSAKNIGILVSLAPTYFRHLEEVAKQQAEKKNDSSSTFVGQVGEKVNFTCGDITCVYTSDSLYGINFMYKMHDESGNVFMWSTSTSVDTDRKYSVVGTIKKHEEFRGVKQTWLTRCKLNNIEDDK